MVSRTVLSHHGCYRYMLLFLCEKRKKRKGDRYHSCNPGVNFYLTLSLLLRSGPGGNVSELTAISVHSAAEREFAKGSGGTFGY